MVKRGISNLDISTRHRSREKNLPRSGRACILARGIAHANKDVSGKVGHTLIMEIWLSGSNLTKKIKEEPSWVSS